MLRSRRVFIAATAKLAAAAAVHVARQQHRFVVTPTHLECTPAELDELLGVEAHRSRPIGESLASTGGAFEGPALREFCESLAKNATSTATTEQELIAAGVDVTSLRRALASEFSGGSGRPQLLLADGLVIPWTEAYFRRFVMPLVPLCSSVTRQTMLHCLGWNAMSLAAFSLYLQPFVLCGLITVDAVTGDVQRALNETVSMSEVRGLLGAPMLLPLQKGSGGAAAPNAPPGSSAASNNHLAMRKRPPSMAKQQERLAELAAMSKPLADVAAECAQPPPAAPSPAPAAPASPAAVVTFASQPTAESVTVVGKLRIPATIPANRHGQLVFLYGHLRDLQRRVTDGEPHVAAFYYRVWDLIEDAEVRQINKRRELRLREAQRLGMAAVLEQLMALRITSLSTAAKPDERKVAVEMLATLATVLGPRPVSTSSVAPPAPPVATAAAVPAPSTPSVAAPVVPPRAAAKGSKKKSKASTASSHAPPAAAAAAPAASNAAHVVSL